MKQIIIFLSLLTINIVTSQFYAANSCNDGDGAIGCSDDCTARQICLNGQVKNVKCPKSSLNLPTYCNSVSLECDLKKKCANENNLICPGRGTYPHLLNCHKVFMCEKKGAIGVLKTCGLIKKYDPASETCVNINFCLNFSPFFGLCLGKKDQIVVHPQNNKLFVHCNLNNPTLGSCTDGHVFNTDTLKCEFKCTKSGLFVKVGDKKCYYKCTWGLFKYKYEEKCCEGEDEVFNDKLKMCGPDVSRKLQIE